MKLLKYSLSQRHTKKQKPTNNLAMRIFHFTKNPQKPKTTKQKKPIINNYKRNKKKINEILKPSLSPSQV